MFQASHSEPTFGTDPIGALARYRERGYHIEPELLREELCDDVVGFANTLDNARDGFFRPIPMPHRAHPRFLEMMRYPPVVEIVEQLVGGQASGIGGEFFYMRPGTRGFAVHQDNAYVRAPDDAFVSAWAALCDTDPENGGVYFRLGTHRAGLLPIRELVGSADLGQNPGADKRECIVSEGYPRADIVVPKGAVLFFHALLAHGSNDNTSDRFRYTLLFTYIRSAAPFRPGRTQKRVEVELYAS